MGEDQVRVSLSCATIQAATSGVLRPSLSNQR
jgi:hypothetical protein